MSSWRKPITAAALTGVLAGGTLIGIDIFHNAQFAMAEDQVQATRQQLSTLSDLSAVYREVGEVVKPSVVNIQVTKTVPHESSQIPKSFERFFHDFGNNGQFNLPPEAFGDNSDQGTSNDQGTMREVGTGSGVIMDASDGYGYILTNNHVAGGASEMVVTLNDGRVIKDAQLVEADPKTDLAVVKIKADNLIPAKWGDSSKLEAGDEIVAFGSPFGYVGSMTHGIVSALHRQAGILGQDGYENFIQVDAPINPGNSGGPLVNLRGEVVGINTAIATSSGGFEGIGFAIPSDEARPIYNELKSDKKIVRGWLGVEIQNVAQATDQAASEGYKAYTGVLVHEVMKNSPAAGELNPGDIITSLNGKTVDNTSELRDEIAWTAPGTDVALGVFHDGKQQDVKIKVGESPTNATAEATPANNATETPTTTNLGMQLSDVNATLAQQFGLTEKSGAVVVNVDPNSPAANAGIQPGDLITRVGNKSVENADQAKQALTKANLKTGVSLQIDNRQGSELAFIQTQQG